MKDYVDSYFDNNFVARVKIGRFLMLCRDFRLAKSFTIDNSLAINLRKSY